MQVYKLIDDHRRARGIAVTELGALVGMYRSWGQRVCDGGAVPTLGQAVGLADALRLRGAPRRELLRAVAVVRLKLEGLGEGQVDDLLRAAERL